MKRDFFRAAWAPASLGGGVNLQMLTNQHPQQKAYAQTREIMTFRVQDFHQKRGVMLGQNANLRPMPRN